MGLRYEMEETCRYLNTERRKSKMEVIYSEDYQRIEADLLRQLAIREAQLLECSRPSETEQSPDNVLRTFQNDQLRRSIIALLAQVREHAIPVCITFAACEFEWPKGETK